MEAKEFKKAYLHFLEQTKFFDLEITFSTYWHSNFLYFLYPTAGSKRINYSPLSEMLTKIPSANSTIRDILSKNLRGIDLNKVYVYPQIILNLSSLSFFSGAGQKVERVLDASEYISSDLVQGIILSTQINYSSLLSTIGIGKSKKTTEDTAASGTEQQSETEESGEIKVREGGKSYLEKLSDFFKEWSQKINNMMRSAYPTLEYLGTIKSPYYFRTGADTTLKLSFDCNIIGLKWTDGETSDFLLLEDLGNYPGMFEDPPELENVKRTWMSLLQQSFYEYIYRPWSIFKERTKFPARGSAKLLTKIIDSTQIKSPDSEKTKVLIPNWGRIINGFLSDIRFDFTLDSMHYVPTVFSLGVDMIEALYTRFSWTWTEEYSLGAKVLARPEEEKEHETTTPRD